MSKKIAVTVVMLVLLVLSQGVWWALAAGLQQDGIAVYLPAVLRNVMIETTPEPTPGPTPMVPDLQSDEFNTTTQSDFWDFANPTGQGTLTLNGTQAVITVPEGVDHDIWGGQNNAVRLMQAAPNADFEIEVKFDHPGMELLQDHRYTMEGVLVEQDAGTFLRLEFHHELTDPGFTLYVYAVSFDNWSPTERVRTSITPSATLYMRVQRQGDQWTLQYSGDGATWTDATTFTQVMNVSAVGVYGANAADGALTPPANTTHIDHFRVISPAP